MTTEMKKRVFRRMANRGAICALLACLGFGFSSMAYADCGTDFQAMMKRRDAIGAQISAMSQHGKAKLDPVAACPKFRALASVVGEMLAYMEKNKEWCNIRDQDLDAAKKARGQIANTANQACGFAKKMEQMKAQSEKQASEGAFGGSGRQEMPHGPLN